jgi:MFS family permease
MPANADNRADRPSPPPVRQRRTRYSPGQATPPTLLVFTFLTGTCTALVALAWQSIVPQLVPKENLRPAVAANSVGVNISRAVGPAVGGVSQQRLRSLYRSGLMPFPNWA